MGGARLGVSFPQSYPQIRGTVSREFVITPNQVAEIGQTLSDQSKISAQVGANPKEVSAKTCCSPGVEQASGLSDSASGRIAESQERRARTPAATGETPVPPELHIYQAPKFRKSTTPVEMSKKQR